MHPSVDTLRVRVKLDDIFDVTTSWRYFLGVSAAGSANTVRSQLQYKATVLIYELAVGVGLAFAHVADQIPMDG